MSTAIQTDARIVSVDVTDQAIIARLADGRIVSVPLAWSWRLSDATPLQRAHWEIIGDGQGVRWPDVDEDISLEGMFRGVPARRPSLRRPT
jgi:regulator of protease activity HflC (stomatin/prohibitin superfamily)